MPLGKEHCTGWWQQQQEHQQGLRAFCDGAATAGCLGCWPCSCASKRRQLALTGQAQQLAGGQLVAVEVEAAHRRQALQPLQPAQPAAAGVQLYHARQQLGTAACSCMRPAQSSGGDRDGLCALKGVGGSAGSPKSARLSRWMPPRSK